jgi:hypothetical protein
MTAAACSSFAWRGLRGNPLRSESGLPEILKLPQCGPRTSKGEVRPLRKRYLTPRSEILSNISARSKQ